MINFNGTFFTNSEAIFNSENRAFKYGDALFETIKVENFKIHFLEDHYFRLMASMRMLRMEIPMSFTLEFLQDEILNTLKHYNLENSKVRLSIFRKDGGFYLPISNQISYLIALNPLNVLQKKKYVVDLFKDYYIHSGLLSTLKTTNKITNVLASIFASENDLDNCILLNERKGVAEAINGNIFVVNGTVIKTPSLSEGCVKGIIRKKVIELLSKSNKFTIEETSISPFELQKCDELFITNAILGVQSITNYKKKIFKTDVATEVSKMILNLV